MIRDAIVVGGGPAGSATAIGLARRGFDVLLLDARQFPRSKPCGDAVSPGAIPLLSDLGVWETICGTPCHFIDGWSLRSPGGTWFETLFDPTRTGSPARGLCIDRATLDDVLVDAARNAGVEVRERTKVFDLVRPSGRIEGVIARGPGGPPIECHARMVVGADGLRSRVARRLGPVVRGRRARLALVGRWSGVAGLAERGEMRISEEGVLGHATLGSGISNLTMTVPIDRAPELAPDPLPFFIENAAQYGLGAALATAELMRPIEVTGPFELRPARRTAPGALLVGDAAGYLDPFTGQGVYRALDGAALAVVAVARALECPTEEAAAFRSYERTLDGRLRAPRAIQRSIDFVVSRSWLIDPAATVLQSRPRLTSWLADVTGDRVRSRVCP
jgi:flavin-dependent dehydrogenase